MQVPSWVPREILPGAAGETLSPSQLLLLTSVIPSLLDAIAEIGQTLRTSSCSGTAGLGSRNAFGDEQLEADVAAERILRAALARCAHVVAASSEEDPVERAVHISSAAAASSSLSLSSSSGASSLPPHTSRSSSFSRPSASRPSLPEVFTAAFDPLDGSSIIGANWAVGTIVGLWRGQSALGVRPDEGLAAAVLGVYGPRTTALIALREPGRPGFCLHVGLAEEKPDDAFNDDKDARADDALGSDGQAGKGRGRVRLLEPGVRLAPPPFPTRYFAPANLRAAAEDPAYAALVSHYIRERYTLRYSGGLVPDVAHALAKGHGVYLSPVAAGARAKLRRLYELCPVALVVECAGGLAVDAELGLGGARGAERILARAVRSCDERGGIFCGTAEEVEAIFALLRK